MSKVYIAETLALILIIPAGILLFVTFMVLLISILPPYDNILFHKALQILPWTLTSILSGSIIMLLPDNKEE